MAARAGLNGLAGVDDSGAIRAVVVVSAATFARSVGHVGGRRAGVICPRVPAAARSRPMPSAASCVVGLQSSERRREVLDLGQGVGIDHHCPLRVQLAAAPEPSAKGVPIGQDVRCHPTSIAGCMNAPQRPYVHAAFRPASLPSVSSLPEVSDWIDARALTPFIEETRAERLEEIDRVAQHVEISLTEVLRRMDTQIGLAFDDVSKGVLGAE